MASVNPGNHITRPVLLIIATVIFTTIISPSAAAEWFGSLRTGYSYTNNLGSQRTVDQGLGTSDPVSRDGWVNQANLLLQSLNANGGQALDLYASFDKGDNEKSDIKNLAVSASLFRALNPRWLWRLSGLYEHYRDDVVTTSSYDGYGAKLTFGYFGNDKQGLDSTLGWNYEAHNKNIASLYNTNRTWLNLVYYLPHSKDAITWSIQAQIRHNISSDSFQDYNSVLLGLTLGNLVWGNTQASVGLRWRSNDYADPSANTSNASPNSVSIQIRNGPGMYTPVNSGLTNPSTDTHDQLLSAVFKLNAPFSKFWRALLSAETGRYTVSTRTDSQNYYRLFTGLQRNF